MLLGTIISILRRNKHGTTLGFRCEVSIDSDETHSYVVLIILTLYNHEILER